jgi:hypothetical protein
LVRRTSSRISSGDPLRSLICRTDVRIRGPGSDPLLIRSRTTASIAAPTLCTVVKPPCSVCQAFSAVYIASSSGFSRPVKYL